MSSELDVHASIEHHCKVQGAEYLAYPPVVAAGGNATTVHYTQNAQVRRYPILRVVVKGNHPR